MAKRMLIIVNPRSGHGVVRNRLLSILDIFTGAGYSVCVHVTQNKGDGARMAREHGPEYDVVVACGGDGTVNEVVSGIALLDSPPVLGVLPAGSTNDYSSSLSIPRGLVAAARAIAGGETFMCDTGFVNGKPFAYCGAFGIFTDVSYSTPQELKNAIGPMAYVLQALKNVGTYHDCHISMQYDGGTVEGDYILGLVTNTVSIGGVRRVFDSVAALDDGCVEITLVRQPSRFTDLQKAINVMLSLEHVETDGEFVTVVNTRWAKLESDKAIPWTIDGEDGGSHTSVEVTVRPSNIPVIRARRGVVYPDV